MITHVRVNSVLLSVGVQPVRRTRWWSSVMVISASQAPPPRAGMVLPARRRCVRSAPRTRRLISRFRLAPSMLHVELHHDRPQVRTDSTRS